MDAVYFLANSVLTFVVYAFLLRLLLQLARADFRNPLSQAIIALTSWLVVPLRRVLPPIGRLDTASVVALLLVQFVAIALLSKLHYGALLPFGAMAIWTLRELALGVILLYTAMIFVGALLSFFAPAAHSPATRILDALCEPVLRPIRAIVPVVGGLDFSPLIALVGLQALRLLIT